VKETWYNLLSKGGEREKGGKREKEEEGGL
jgi:hypothetical protein